MILQMITSNKMKLLIRQAKSLINNQIAKCITSGFSTGLGGVITLLVAIPLIKAAVLFCH